MLFLPYAMSIAILSILKSDIHLKISKGEDMYSVLLHVFDSAESNVHVQKV